MNTLREHLEAIIRDPLVRGRGAGHALAAIDLLNEAAETSDYDLCNPGGLAIAPSDGKGGYDVGATYRLVPDRAVGAEHAPKEHP